MQIIDVCFTSLASVEHLSVLHYSADDIFISFGIIGSIAVSLQIDITMYTQKDVSIVADFLTAYEESQ